MKQKNNNNTQRIYISVNSLQTAKADDRADSEMISVLYLEIDT